MKKKNEENIVQKRVVDFLDSEGFWWERANSGMAIVGEAPYQRAIWLMRKGCPDLIGSHIKYNGRIMGFEIKKSEKEYKRWIGIIDRYKKAIDGKLDLKIKWDTELLLNPKIKKSWKREVGQYKYAIRLTRGGGKYFLTYSVDHLKEQLDKIK